MKDKGSFYDHLHTFGRLKDEHNPNIQNLFKPHKDAFNFATGEGLLRAVENMHDERFLDVDGEKVTLRVTKISVSKPMVHEKNLFAQQLLKYPTECRQAGTTYSGDIELEVEMLKGDTVIGTWTRDVGECPIMVCSNLCNLSECSPAQLVKRKEDENEMGGYFVINGNEKVIRMLVNQRRHFPFTVARNSYKGRGPSFSEFAVQIRCVRTDQTSQRLTLHYLNDGQVILCFVYNKSQYYIPVILIMKSLIAVNDKEIYSALVEGEEDNKIFCESVVAMLRAAQDEAGTHEEVRTYLGKLFRVKLDLPTWVDDHEVTVTLLQRFILVNLTSHIDKYNLLVYMTRKLYAFKHGKCAEESADNPMMHEVMLGGHLYLALLKERTQIWLKTLRIELEKAIAGNEVYKETDANMVTKYMSKLPNIGPALEYLLATGNLRSQSGLDMQQAAGLATVADKLNYQRWLSHFRCIHRGAFFTEMRTTVVRKLRPEAWGFVCPIHTPDGTPCGLLNHLTAGCEVVSEIYEDMGIARHLLALGVTPISAPHSPGCVNVIVDGVMVGFVSTKRAEDVASGMRYLKVTGDIPVTAEIVYLPPMEAPGQFPGLFIFTGPTRMVRNVKNITFNMTEKIGTLEQVYLHVCISDKEYAEGITTHQEFKPTDMLSTLAQLTPFSEYNQSPRNVYQCQMGKQTMGVPSHTIPFRSDSKSYAIQTPQCPMVRPDFYKEYGFDDFPLGTNAIVAVISYTGYDMEDAFILNKGSYERGFAHGSIYKSHVYNLADKKSNKHVEVFGYDGTDNLNLDSDGFPSVGTKLSDGDPLYSSLDLATGKCKITNFQDFTTYSYKGLEPAYIDSVKVLGNDMGTGGYTKVNITLRSTRNPTIGDKFASRHGQKGVCSQLWPVENLPFTEGGMVPDILFNPHGYPSRMTIGMMIETMSGKACAMHGLGQDATPFKFSEENRADDHVGEALRTAGYNYYGTETMYSGQTGEEFEAQIFIGVVYYQRLRHMVSDKYQVRTTGPIDQLTHQPIKGRKRAGGVRFGEMERDALVSHGAAFVMNDRLLNCSDACISQICKTCGKSIGVYLVSGFSGFKTKNVWKCKICQDKSEVVPIQLPYVYNYLTAELAAMNISLSMKLS